MNVVTLCVYTILILQHTSLHVEKSTAWRASYFSIHPDQMLLLVLTFCGACVCVTLSFDIVQFTSFTCSQIRKSWAKFPLWNNTTITILFKNSIQANTISLIFTLSFLVSISMRLLSWSLHPAVLASSHTQSTKSLVMARSVGLLRWCLNGPIYYFSSFYILSRCI